MKQMQQPDKEKTFSLLILKMLIMAMFNLWIIQVSPNNWCFHPKGQLACVIFVVQTHFFDIVLLPYYVTEGEDIYNLSIYLTSSLSVLCTL